MAYEAYRVRKNFGWNGWQFAPDPSKPCPCRTGIEMCHADDEQCTGLPGTSCGCDGSCKCTCQIKKEMFGGGIWIVEEGHPRKEQMLIARHAIYDASLPDIDTILGRKRYSRLLKEPKVALVA